MVPQRLENIDPALGNDMAPEASNPQDMVRALQRRHSRHREDPRVRAYRIHTSLIRNSFHGVARRAGSRMAPRCEGWPRRRESECPRPALSSALTSCAVVSFLRKRCHNEELQATLINTLSAVRMPPRITTSNLDLRAHLASGASISMFCASLHLFFPVTANYLPVMAKSSPCYRPVPRAPPIFLKPLLLK